MSKTSRDKGKRYELEVVKALKPYWPDAKRNLAQFQAVDGRDFNDTRPFCIQAKRRKKVGINEVNTGYLEACESTDERHYPYPAVVWRSDAATSMIAMDLDHFVEVLCLMEDGEL
jgi:hypothetical protein